MQIFNSFTPEVIATLKNGGVGVIPTDTLYGIVASLFNQSAVERIYDIKNRDLKKPIGTVLISDPSQIDEFVAASELLPAEVYWPGPVSVVLELGNKFAYAHRGKKSLPFRIPDDERLRRLVDSVGPLVTTSANLSGSVPAVTVQEAMGTFREAVDFYVDGGDLSGNKPSKIIKLKENGEVEILRGV